MSRVACIFVALSLSTVRLSAVEVVYEGAVPQDTESLQRIINHAMPVPADSVEVLLHNQGYLDASVEWQADRLIVTTGWLYKTDSVYVQDDSGYVLISDRVFNRHGLQELTQRILRQFYDRGYYWASAKVDNVRKRKSRVELELRINKGPLVKLADVVYTGLTRTNRNLVDRYIPMELGGTLTEQAVRRAENAAARIDFVSFHPPAVIRPLEGYTSADLEFQFLEKRQFTFEGGGGYLPNNPASLVWFLNLHFNNLFGRGRQATIFSDRRERGRNVLRLGYRQPLFVTGVGQLSFEVGTRDYRDQFYEFSMEGAYLSRLNSRVTIGLDLGWKSVQLTGGFPAYSRFTSRFSVEWEALDAPLNPASGLDFQGSVAYSYRRYAKDTLAIIPQKNSFQEARISVSANWYRQIVGRLVSHLGLRYIGLETDELLPPFSELILLGGPGTVRSFRNEQFAVLRTVIVSVEPRLRFSYGYLFPFYDGAYLSNRVSNLDKTVGTEELFRSGYGVGLTLHDNGRSVKLSLGWNPELQFDQPRLSVEFSSDI